MYSQDKRIVITLDAGGTNFVFGAMQGNRPIVDPITLPSQSDNLDRCLGAMVEGFERIMAQLDEKPVAISFAFPGPADYRNGIIGGWLPNFPSFREGVALGPFLEERFGIPVYINNDGDLFAYGEALGGALPMLNEQLAAAGSEKRYRNLVGYTFGTGFGVGIVIDGRLNRGDNSCVETFCLEHHSKPGVIVEEGVSKDLFDIAEGHREGDQEAARKAFAEMGATAGYAMATAVTFVDGPIVIGGGVAAASKYILPSLFEAMRSKLSTLSGEEVRRVQMEVYDLDNEAEFARFAKGAARPLKVYGSERTVNYDPEKRIGILISKLGASRAIALGAYAFALSMLDEK